MEAIADKLTTVGLMYMGMHFLPRRKLWLKDRYTWRIKRDGREVRSWTDYILGTDRRLFQDVAVRNTRHHLDHYMVLGCLRVDPTKELEGYLRKSRRSPLCCDLLSAPDKLFSERNTQIPNPPPA